MFTTNICDVFIYLFYFFQLDTPPLKCKWELFISHENKLNFKLLMNHSCY